MYNRNLLSFIRIRYQLVENSISLVKEYIEMYQSIKKIGGSQIPNQNQVCTTSLEFPEVPKRLVSVEQNIELDILVTDDPDSEACLFRRNDELRGRCNVAGRSGTAGLWLGSPASTGMRRRVTVANSSSAVANGARPLPRSRKKKKVFLSAF